MNQINYFLSLVISFFGLFIGLALAYIAPEELKPGEKYLLLVQNIVLTAIIFVFVYYLKNHIFLTTIFSMIILLFLFFKRISTKAIYLFLGFLFFFSSRNETMFLLESVLIFFYGFPTGTLFVKKLIKKPKLEVVKKLFLNYSLFLLLSTILYLTNSFL